MRIPSARSIEPRTCGDSTGSGCVVEWSHTLYGGWQTARNEAPKGCGETAYCVSADAYEVVWQCPECGWAYAVANPGIP